MAVIWSWAFGAETTTELDEMGFARPINGGTQAPQSGPTNVYSYPAFPGIKYSWGCSGFRWLEYPSSVSTVTGSVAAAINSQLDWRADSDNWLIGFETASGRKVRWYVTNAGTETTSCFVDNVLAGTVVVASGDWQYVAINYDVSTVNWTASFWLNGAQIASGTSTEVAETSVRYEHGGFSSSGLALLAQLIVYDNATTAADAATPLFVTRLPPNADDSTVGTWVPSAGATNIGVTNNNPFDPATYTQEATPSSGDNVVTEVNNLVAQLGVTAGSVLGATNHTYSSGTALQAFASCRDSGQVYTDGATITPDASDPTYAFATTTTGLTGTSTIDCKYEIV
jgi:hypothetical protein